MKITLVIVIITSIFVMINNYKKNKPLESIKVDNNKVSKETYAIYKENNNGEYEIYDNDTFPSEGYELNLTKSYCVDKNQTKVDGVLSIDNNKPKVTSDKTLYCYLYFDIEIVLANKEVSENNVKFEVYPNINGIECLYGSENNITSIATYENGKCVYPVTAEYAKVCINRNEKTKCSNKKQLAWYFIKNGRVSVPIDSNIEISYNSDNLSFEIPISISGRRGIYTTTLMNFSIYDTVYSDISYVSNINGTTQPMFSIIISSNNWIINPNSENRNAHQLFYWRELGTYNETINQSRKIFATKLKDAASEPFENFTSDYLSIGRNHSSQNIQSSIYNVWFQLKD